MFTVLIICLRISHAYISICIKYVCVIVDMKDDTVPSYSSGVTNSVSGESSMATAGGRYGYN